MATKLKDISNKKFGKLTALNIAYRKNYLTYWKCKCDCGNYKIVLLSNLTTGKIQSCGCKYKEMGQSLRKYNKYEIKTDCVELYTFNTNNKFIIDLDDFEKIKEYCWFENNYGYIMNRTNHKNIMLHRLITNCPNNKVVDHIDHNTLNNRKSNLKVCTQKENMQNRLIKDNNLLGCYGITKIKRKNNEYYIVQINGYKGCYKSFEEAKSVRDKFLFENSKLGETI